MAQPPNPPTHPVAGASSLYRQIPCRAPGCKRWFGNNAGLTKHMQTKHSFTQPREHREPPHWQLEEDPDPPDVFNAPADVAAPVRRSEWEYHPHLCGEFSLLAPFARPTEVTHFLSYSVR